MIKKTGQCWTIADFELRLYCYFTMSSLSYRILPNPDDNTHEVRLIVDGTDWIGEGHLGLDPPDLVSQLTEERRSRLILGRCGCGVLGCDDLVVDIKRTTRSVEWSCLNRKPIVFDTDHFDNQVRTLANDHTWEPVGRTVERRLTEIFSGKITDDGYVYDWSSTRIQPNLVIISVTKEGHQKLLEFSWDGESVVSALRRGGQFLRERFDD
ncbi:hypothetical protein ADU59_25180 [Pararhizobium polonicum]|uniref:Uncharacterized protein n=1 Tax=Pararhizobium polonicum TaxID=1612624 RepID=A0A1C7NYU1_9HYPH|nr:hypothetical protein [Pararhizobium polonicum]OBZ92684.1 hypothetical protein ADU59_25180 [Pararhizobium polonicum]